MRCVELTVRGIFPSIFVAVALALSPAAQADVFYRIIDGDRPGPAEVARDRFLYGSEILYTGDAPKGPVRVEGTVWHSNLSEARYFIGTRNPVIDERALMELIQDNKWEEAKILMKHVPDAFPRTENLAKLLASNGFQRAQASDLTWIQKMLQERYPRGYFLKTVSGFFSAGNLPTEKTDLVNVHRKFVKDVKPLLEETLARTGDITETHLELMGLPNYEGRVIDALLEHPETVIIQEKIDVVISRGVVDEYRLHVADGKVIRGATQHRWDDARLVTRESLAEVDRFAQNALDRLPPAMRRMSYALDVMRTRDGGFQIIELNPGGESGYLYPETDIWVSQLLANRYTGRMTPLQRMVDAMRRAPSLTAKEAALKKILSIPELAEVVDEAGPMGEIWMQAKDAFIDELKRNPTRESAFAVLGSIKAFKVEDCLSIADVEYLATNLRDLAGLTPAVTARHLALAPGELLFAAGPSRVRLLTGVAYNDVFVRNELERWVRKEARARGLSPSGQADALALERLALEATDRHVFTRAQIRAVPGRLDLIQREAAALSTGTRWIHSGSRASIVAELMRVLRR